MKSRSATPKKHSLVQFPYLRNGLAMVIGSGGEETHKITGVARWGGIRGLPTTVHGLDWSPRNTQA